MGIFDFLKKNKDDDFFIEAKKNAMAAGKSFNFRFNGALKAIYIDSALSFDTFISDVDKYLALAAYAVKKTNKIPIDERFLHLKRYNAKNNQGDRSIIFETPMCLYTECEHNYIALVTTNQGEKKMFSGEYWVDCKKYTVRRYEGPDFDAPIYKYYTEFNEFLEIIGFELC